jgi:hypothetical protein
VRGSTAETGHLKQASMARLWEVAAAVVVYVAVFTIQRLLRVLKSSALGKGQKKMRPVLVCIIFDGSALGSQANRIQ